MENFTNDIIDTAKLPKFEEVEFTALHPDYWKVTVIHLIIVFAILGVVSILLLTFNEQLAGFQYYFAGVGIALFLLTILFSRISYKKKAFAFRNHDVLFKYGFIAETKIVIPYNRIQHVALHEGLLSRYFGVATVEIFTAGGSSSDISIPGIQKDQAENIRQLLMNKIQKQL